MSRETKFDTEEITKEALDEANRRLAAMTVGAPGVEPKMVEVEPVLSKPQTLPPAETETKRTRISVAKLAQRYQEREAALLLEIAQTESAITTLQADLAAKTFKLGVWREALAEINAD